MILQLHEISIQIQISACNVIVSTMILHTHVEKCKGNQCVITSAMCNIDNESKWL